MIADPVADAVVEILRVAFRRKPEEPLNRGHWIMIALAMVFLVVAIAVLARFGLVRRGS